jgi:hypothetical protein
MRILLASVLATLALVFSSANATAQVRVQDNGNGTRTYYWIYPQNPTYLPQNPNPPASLAPRSYRYGTYVSPFTPFYYAQPGAQPYSRYTAPLWYYNGPTNTYYYGRGYYLGPGQ